MKVSVIISNFNGARYLPKLLATLRSQQHVDLEIIVVDRASSDESHAMLTSCEGITLLHHPPETGLVSGYHVGAAHASHDLLFFCNEDMWFDARCLEHLAARIDIRNGIIASDPWHWNYHETDRWLGHELLSRSRRRRPLSTRLAARAARGDRTGGQGVS